MAFSPGGLLTGLGEYEDQQQKNALQQGKSGSGMPSMPPGMMQGLFGVAPAALATMGAAGSGPLGAELGGIGGGLTAVGSDVGSGLSGLFAGGDAGLMAGALAAF